MIAIGLVVAAPAAAADRTLPVASFARLRVDGPVDVDVVVGSPRAQASADDRRALEALSIVLEGDTLVVRLNDPEKAPRARVALATPRLAAVRHRGTGKVTIARLTAERVDIASTGNGSVAVATIVAPAVTATLVGKGTMTLAGKPANARLTLNGDELLDAASLNAGEADVSLVGNGELRGAARYAARVIARGKGRVTVTGPMRCAVRAGPDAVVACGR